ncbi:PREDICTED: uncharacterized protein LOC101311978 isoform X1 [Fragaria vesca subsp. vesca]|uniref:uncharacterized protein LOC101311978 isoform X1 n=1 Tax=Fragaria vesca subsp. vesca TaxID=101020 RepID=UPI0002C34FD9|nr:PREDICTED: uncharacterized protein LOC101311978 isoform X1 [Fragaria vesca subsp. vesca]
MTTPSHTLNYPFHKLAPVDTHKTLYKTRWNQGFAALSPVLLHAESGKFPKYKTNSGLIKACSDSFLGVPNTIGIIGGVSVDSTVYFLKKLVHWSKNGEGCPPFVLCCDPVLNKELSLIQRSSAPLLNNKYERTTRDPTSVVENLRNKRIYLEHSGACCIVMPCHMSHSWHNEISEGCSVPFLHMGECVVKELKEAKLRPLEAGSPLRIGLLATKAILTAGFYQEKLKSEGFEVVLPDEATMEHTIIPAIEALNRKDIEGSQNLLRIALQVLLVRAVNSVILASDDIRDLLPQDDPLLEKCIDPMDALARSTIKLATSVENVKRSVVRKELQKK